MRPLPKPSPRHALLLLAFLVPIACGPEGRRADAAPAADQPAANAGASPETAAPAGFARFDINQDGWLSGNELDACACADRDADGDREVTPAEFAAGGAAPAPAPAEETRTAAAPPAAGAPPEGYYECYFYGDYGLQNSSMISMRIHSATAYEAMEERGRYAFEAAEKSLRMETGPLAGRVARLRESDGKPAIVFIRKENEVGGRPTIDISDTWCYHEPG